MKKITLTFKESGIVMATNPTGQPILDINIEGFGVLEALQVLLAVQGQLLANYQKSLIAAPVIETGMKILKPN